MYEINWNLHYLNTESTNQNDSHLTILHYNTYYHKQISALLSPSHIVKKEHSVLRNVYSLQTNNDEPNYTRNINNKNNIAEFQLKLSWE